MAMPLVGLHPAFGRVTTRAGPHPPTSNRVAGDAEHGAQVDPEASRLDGRVRLGKGADRVAVLSREDADPGQVAVVEHRPVQQEAPVVARREQMPLVLLLQVVGLYVRLISQRPFHSSTRV
jgi:hypothetical protein